jgi:Aminopeptidase C
MKFKYTTLAVLLLASTQIFAQNLGEQQIKDLKNSFSKDANTKSIQNILTNDKDIKGKTLNRDIQGKTDHYFKYKTNVSGITNQYSSGRCWMFTSMNALRPSVMEKYNISEFDFSHNYNYFWDMLEKSNLFLENIKKTANKDMDDRGVVFYFSSPVGDGGVWNLFYNLGEKYGVVPQSVMPETEHSNNTSQMVRIINERLRKGGYEIREAYSNAISGEKNPKAKTIEKAENQMNAIKTATLKDVYRVLALCLGEPPTEFTWRYKTKDNQIKSITTTPQEFYKNIVPSNYNPDNFVMIMNDPTREYYKVYEIDNYRNSIEGVNWKYLNLPNQEIKEAALKSIKNNEPMYGSCDVGKQSNTKEGILDPNMYDYESLLGIDLKMDKKARILTRQSGSSHAMLIVSCDTDENDKPTKWEFENSWGSSSGNRGYLTFTDEWFDEYLFRIVINKKYLSEKAQKATQEKPIMLPAWDYMF